MSKLTINGGGNYYVNHQNLNDVNHQHHHGVLNIAGPVNVSQMIFATVNTAFTGHGSLQVQSTGTTNNPNSFLGVLIYEAQNNSTLHLNITAASPSTVEATDGTIILTNKPSESDNIDKNKTLIEKAIIHEGSTIEQQGLCNLGVVHMKSDGKLIVDYYNKGNQVKFIPTKDISFNLKNLVEAADKLVKNNLNKDNDEKTVDEYDHELIYFMNQVVPQFYNFFFKAMRIDTKEIGIDTDEELYVPENIFAEIASFLPSHCAGLSGDINDTTTPNDNIVVDTIVV
ncbi:MAG: hypothetical protein HRU35_04375 [Rickettsiaceae bacterium]|nr:hypothetical protein [Rickettsiaceae bacterium]